MTKLLDLSGKIEEPTVRLYEVLNEVTRSLGIRYFVVGATARDTILEHGFGIPSPRATKDVDIGVRVSGWGEFDGLKRALTETGQFEETREVQRLSYDSNVPVDIVPFGEIANRNHKIVWPEEEVIMSAVGFEEAYAAALQVRIGVRPSVEILVASLAGLAIMKIVAWQDRPQIRKKDARDLAFILEKYLDAGNIERLVKEHENLMTTERFDYVQAGARLLGRDMGMIVLSETKARIQQILQDQTAEGGQFLLVQQIAQASTLSGEEEDHFDEVISWLKALSTGIDEGYRH